MPDGPKNAKITLSFPLSAAPLPLTLTSPNHCRSSSSSSSPSPQRRRQTSKCSDEGALWKLDSTTDVKHRPFKPPRRDSSPSSSPSSSSSPMTAHTLMRKDIKSPPPLKCSKLSADTPFHRSPPRSSSGALEGCYGGDVWDERHKLSNSTASQTAQILFSLGSAYNRPGDAEGREKITRRPAGKPGGSHGPSLHPPTLHLPPPLPPPPPSEGHTAPSHPSSYSPSDSLKPELICGVCHRLFSSAASLTVHMRLHRGSRALSCRYCGKVFIHSKRLQSHEASCRVPELPSSSLGPPSLTIDDAAAAELLAGDEHHFVKVVDGNVIYFCSVCERSYMTLSSLKRHSNVHSWRRKYPCHYCDKVFALAEYRTKHEVWHTGERRYQCIFCWDAFATYYNLKTHQKTIHGINPSLISSEKTANGGYKQKANALKLYRLLPMRSQKRPYKTYSDGLHNGLLSSRTKMSKVGRCPDTIMPSVITYGHTKPSVIVHGKTVSSSVIVHSNQVTSLNDKTDCSSSLSSSQTLHKSSPKSMKKQRDTVENHRKRSRDSSDTTDEGSRGKRDSDTGTKSLHKSRKSHGKSEVSVSKQQSPTVSSQGKDTGPLCQITVRIGEEAIVKRSISETDLRRDKKVKHSRQSKQASPDQQESDHDNEDNLWRPYYSYKPKRKVPAHLQRVKTAPAALKRRPWTNGNASECGTCGRWFSSTRKRDKHELNRVSSPSRLSRRALSRHTCPQCHKVCKTSSALNRHIRRHELSSSPERDDREEPKTQIISRELQSEKEQAPLSLSVSEYPLPLTVPDSYRSDKKQDDALLMPSYPTGTLPFGTLGKVVVPNGADLSKIPFYPDPYPLLYGPQLLAYPYNLAALPVALNMMAPGGDKVEPLPFLPAIFNYATGPYMGAAPHPLVANTTLYSTGSSEGKKQRDSTSKP
uniref:C2H2-type domain-containing protein n=1 Tax=Periophthalmus magnuspinnatus TaxID=409849 RepID=A0A3B4B5H3_9GOBI